MNLRFLKITALILTVCLMLASCRTYYMPIVKVSKFYPPTNYVTVVYDRDDIPEEVQYIGTIKIVPGDRSFPRNYFDAAMEIIKKEAMNVGARYMLLVSANYTNTDYRYIRLDATWGDGYTIECEVYR